MRLPILFLTVTALFFSCSSPTEEKDQLPLNDSNTVAAATTDTTAALPANGDTLAPDSFPVPAAYADDYQPESKSTSPLVGKHLFGVQFIWDHYGSATISHDGDQMRITGTQFSKDKTEYCQLEGTVTVIDDRKFAVEGTLKLFTKDCCGVIEKTGTFTFLKSGKRKFWRLQDFDQLCSQYTCAYYLDIFE